MNNTNKHLTDAARSTAAQAERILEIEDCDWHGDDNNEGGICKSYDSRVDARTDADALEAAGMIASVATSSSTDEAWLYVAPGEAE